MSSAKFNILQPSFSHHNNIKPPAESLLLAKPETSSAASSPILQRSTVRKSFKRRLPQNLPVRDTAPVPDQPAQSSRPNLKNSLGPDPPASVARRNARERNRVKQVNTGFAVLRQHIPVLIGSAIVYGGSPHSTDSSSSATSPNGNKKNKMSKVETLRCAVEYIRNLEKLLATGGVGEQHPMTSETIKEEPFDIPFSPLPESENISPSKQHDLSGFYDSSSSSESPDQLFSFESTNSRHKESPECAAFKQELLRSLSCWNNRSDQDSHHQHPSSTSEATDLLLESPAMQNISDHSLLESLNSWWCPGNL